MELLPADQGSAVTTFTLMQNQIREKSSDMQDFTFGLKGK